jgi:hypothetical protein
VGPSLLREERSDYNWLLPSTGESLALSLPACNHSLQLATRHLLSNEWVGEWINYDRRSVGQSILVSSPIWGSRPDINYYLIVTVFFFDVGLPLWQEVGSVICLSHLTASVQLALGIYAALSTEGMDLAHAVDCTWGAWKLTAGLGGKQFHQHITSAKFKR